jgi:uncharacterized protein
MPNRTTKPRQHPTHPKVVHEVVDPRWILSALGGTILFAMLCAWIAVCFLFYRGQWQLVLQPSHTIAKDPSTLGLAFTEVHFGVDSSGQPQLDGWWIPSDSPSDPTVLILHPATGSVADALPDASTLHAAHLNILLFDYRGFGHSLGQHPTQSLMQTDAESAFRYLTEIRKIPAASILPFGRGAGASLAVHLAAAHKDLPALILLAPEGDFTSRVRQDSRSRMVPVGLLFNQPFPLAAPLQTLTTPKLLISYTGNTPPALHQAADPKTTVELQPTSPPSALTEAIRRFLDTYLSQPIPTLIPPTTKN